jgi:nucleotide-binding universal stress UspA family protein
MASRDQNLNHKETTMLAIHAILHPTDFSQPAAEAFRLACSLARDHGARLVAVHVVIPPVVTSVEGVMVPAPEVDRNELLRQLRLLQDEAPGVTMEFRLLEGAPAAEILAAAKEAACDLIVIGTHGRTGLGRLLMGSVAEQVVRKALCPVLTVKSTPSTENAVRDEAPVARQFAEACH